MQEHGAVGSCAGSSWERVIWQLSSGGSRAERRSAGERSSEDYLGIPEPKQIIVPDGEKDGVLRDLMTHKHVMRYADWGTPCEFIV